MKSVHLTKVATRHSQVQEYLAEHGTLDGSNYNVDRLINTDVPDLIQSVREAKDEIAALRRQLNSRNARAARYKVTVWSDAPLRVSRVTRQEDSEDGEDNG